MENKTMRKILVTGLGLAAGYCAKKTIEEMVNVSVKSSGTTKEKVIKAIGGALIVAAVGKLAEDFVEDTVESVFQVADTVKEVVADVNDGKNLAEILTNMLEEEEDENGGSEQGTDNEESRGHSAEQPSGETTSSGRRGGSSEEDGQSSQR